MDYNREVRRATHDTMTNLVTAVGFVLGLFVYECSSSIISMVVGISNLRKIIAPSFFMI